MTRPENRGAHIKEGTARAAAGPPAHRRRGTIYIFVLGVAMLVTVIGLSALAMIRIQRRGVGATGDWVQARLHARSAIELGMHHIDSQSGWRGSKPSGAWDVDVPVGSGTFTLEAVDPDDGDFANPTTGAIVLTATGVHGQARHKTRVRLLETNPSIDALELSLAVGGSISFDGAIVNSNETISSNAAVTATGSSIFSYVESADLVTGCCYSPGPGSYANPRTLPDSLVFDYYIANGTPIDYATLDSAAGGAMAIQNNLLSPAHNPYGTGQTNPDGIYVVDCQGGDIRLQYCRIVGTLVLLNVGEEVRLLNAINWEPAVPNHPALLVQGRLELWLDQTELSDEGTKSIPNLNPPGTPYNGQEDTTEDDVYATVIRGLVYASGDIDVDADPVVDGAVVAGGAMTMNTASLTLTYQSTWFDDPPPGFRTSSQTGVHIVPGSWEQVVD